MPMEMWWVDPIQIKYWIQECIYQVDFAGGEVTELIANVIAESMYAQCDPDGNEYLLLDALVDYGKDNKATSLSDQQI